MSSNFLVFHTSAAISSKSAAYLLFKAMKSSSSVNCPSLMFCLTFIVSPVISEVYLGNYRHVLLTSKMFFLTGSSKFCF